VSWRLFYHLNNWGATVDQESGIDLVLVLLEGLSAAVAQLLAGPVMAARSKSQALVVAVVVQTGLMLTLPV
jgi:hypothetical protein